MDYKLYTYDMSVKPLLSYLKKLFKTNISTHIPMYNTWVLQGYVPKFMPIYKSRRYVRINPPMYM